MIVLFTDFGLEGPYVGQIKAVLCREAPGVPVIDLFHDAPAHEPELAAYLLAAYAVTCGITFTFGGVRIDREARVLDTEEAPIHGLYAAGELVGGLFYFNYPGGTGLTAGAVFGRIAGASAARAM